MYEEIQPLTENEKQYVNALLCDYYCSIFPEIDKDTIENHILVWLLNIKKSLIMSRDVRISGAFPYTLNIRNKMEYV